MIKIDLARTLVEVQIGPDSTANLQVSQMTVRGQRVVLFALDECYPITIEAARALAKALNACADSAETGEGIRL